MSRHDGCPLSRQLTEETVRESPYETREEIHREAMCASLLARQRARENGERVPVKGGVKVRVPLVAA